MPQGPAELPRYLSKDTLACIGPSYTFFCAGCNRKNVPLGYSLDMRVTAKIFTLKTFVNKGDIIPYVHQATAHTGSRNLTAVFLPLSVVLYYFSKRTKWFKNYPDSSFIKSQFFKIFSAV
jgi:hypothetical protein